MGLLKRKLSPTYYHRNPSKLPSLEFFSQDVVNAQHTKNYTPIKPPYITTLKNYLSRFSRSRCMIWRIIYISYIRPLNKFPNSGINENNFDTNGTSTASYFHSHGKLYQYGNVPEWAKGPIRYFDIFHDRDLGSNLRFRNPEKLSEE